MNYEKRFNVKEKMRLLGESWEREYRFTCYHTYLGEEDRRGWKEEDWKNIQAICREIERMCWEDDIEFLKHCQAEAFCKIGILYVEKGNFDCACEMLEKAAGIMEENCFQYVLPKYYIWTYIYLARAYTEKHCNDTKIEGYCEKAGAVLTGMSEYKSGSFSDRKVEWSPMVAGCLKVELMHIWIITKSNAYRREKNVHILTENKKIKKYLGEVWDEIQKLEQSCTPDEAEKEDADKWKKLWVRKQKDTYWASKGIYYKWLYFTCKDSKYPLDRDACFRTAVRAFVDGVKADRGNTISAGNIAALLYNYETEIYTVPEHVEDKKFLVKILDSIKEELEITEELNSVDEYIEFFLEMVFRADRNNMFALNLKAICEEQSNRNETYPYLTLRQSALKKRFDKMDAQLPSNEIDHTDKLRGIKTCIINLHAEVAQYMSEAVYPRDKFKGFIVGHYTKTSVLPRLLNWEGNSRLRIRNVKHLNDPSEGALFMGYINQKIMSSVSAEAGKGSNSLIRNLLQIYEYKRREEWNQKSSVYMGSFTSRIDQLNMWSRYGDAGKGCCICINADESFDESTAVPLAEISMEEDNYRYKLEDNQYPLYMVLYLPGNTEIDLKTVEKYASKRKEAEKVKRESLEGLQLENKDVAQKTDVAAKERKRCAEEENWWDAQAKLTVKFGELIEKSSFILEQIQKEYQSFVSEMKDTKMTGKNWAILEEEIINTLMMILDQVRFLVKDDSYRDEREYRVIQYSYEPEYEGGEDIPKLYVNIEKDLKYKTVVFGPLTQNYASDSAYVLNMRKKTPEKTDGKSLGLDVYKSDIPYCC